MANCDPWTFRAIAHPVRRRLLAEISVRGALRAADVARELDVPANVASFHLRRLAKYGLIEEDPRAARDRRDRAWRLTEPVGTGVAECMMMLSPDEAEQLRTEVADVLARWRDRVRGAPDDVDRGAYSAAWWLHSLPEVPDADHGPVVE